ncbi:MAG TPA: bifunctional riboflavin kinase/FAD synthetase [Bacteroidales bacterium]|nr:MAG: Riboflavin biosynthesis protein RibF [Bacteroidetes bacterium ADurb.Bin041]HNV49583.1 bifunctional riboflavin kinase/FAD synthetase [Bacteroidales bacterium]HNY59237.1 bifunctional riboflavin kinase/FAD synthetase [Bacteroidales bacterium]HOG66488.1 bifunctional riboflavin kinase/FAD synthetase [Bacteroidales bacterium]HPW42786.1 bifunctional riboflavin kinase/FAD synthetase [Bacteroidales bacterium]
MRIYKDIADIGKIKNAVVTVGTFDGVHIGHQLVIAKLVEAAKRIEGESVLITFEPHPRIVVQPGYDLRLILSMDERVQIFSQLGVDHLFIIHFTKEFAQFSSEYFLEKYIYEVFKPVKLIIGYDHQFGKERRGDIHFLGQMAAKLGFAVEQIEAEDLAGFAISSTRIRDAIKKGDMQLVSNLLGYYYSISGVVVKGNRLGRTLGFPTANIHLDDPEKLIPYYGVYATLVDYKGTIYKGMSNIGIRPTLNQHNLNIEVNIFDFNKEIYGENLRLYLVEHTRDEKRFRDLDLLRRRLVIDQVKIKKILESVNVDQKLLFTTKK